ncbi:hypothetical protein BpHYR1_029958 [Brachionus plicatilis]|uniref:Uncharacterized protein n=1 Tax=Brachionus plicatilis TaxID=10195 RepID=A0A3M7P4B6_BRAPC|nr:hypothetical protein BpHYR1_029958 [Brachionus plicatilis]
MENSSKIISNIDYVYSFYLSFNLTQLVNIYPEPLSFGFTFIRQKSEFNHVINHAKETEIDFKKQFIGFVIDKKILSENKQIINLIDTYWGKNKTKS